VRDPCRSSTMEHPRSRPLREAAPPPAYLSAEQLAQQTPWSIDALEKMIQRGDLRRGLHWFQPKGAGTQRIFKWSAIVAWIEQETDDAIDGTSPHALTVPDVDVVDTPRPSGGRSRDANEIAARAEALRRLHTD
jgi:hypothetical protein